MYGLSQKKEIEGETDRKKERAKSNNMEPIFVINWGVCVY